jgi:hypothetical protein
MLRSVIAQARSSYKPNPFGERFKYDVISSSLLSTSISTLQSPPHRNSPLPIPGRLKGHTPMSSTDGNSDAENEHSSSIRTHPPPTTDLTYWLETAAFAVAAITIGLGHYFISFLILAGTFYHMHVASMEAAFKSDVMTSVSDNDI